jgi:hypothetical protein
VQAGRVFCCIARISYGEKIASQSLSADECIEGGSHPPQTQTLKGILIMKIQRTILLATLALAAVMLASCESTSVALSKSGEPTGSSTGPYTAYQDHYGMTTPSTQLQ